MDASYSQHVIREDSAFFKVKNRSHIDWRIGDGDGDGDGDIGKYVGTCSDRSTTLLHGGDLQRQISSFPMSRVQVWY